MADANAILLHELVSEARWLRASIAVRQEFLRFAKSRAIALMKAQIRLGIDRFGNEMRVTAPVKPSSRPDGAKGAPLDPHGRLSRCEKWLRGSINLAARGVTLFWSHAWARIVGYHGDGKVKGAPRRDIRGMAPKTFAKFRRELAARWERLAPEPRAKPKPPAPAPRPPAPLAVPGRKLNRQEEAKVKQYPYLADFYNPPKR